MLLWLLFSFSILMFSIILGLGRFSLVMSCLIIVMIFGVLCVMSRFRCLLMKRLCVLVIMCMRVWVCFMLVLFR